MESMVGRLGGGGMVEEAWWRRHGRGGMVGEAWCVSMMGEHGGRHGVGA